MGGIACLTLTSCDSTNDESLRQIAEAIALELDSLNGLPTVVLDEYLCRIAEERCRERVGHPPASLVDATKFVSAFANARQIPVARYEEAGHPECRWAQPTNRGMWAEFAGPPEIDGTTAEVDLITGCVERGAVFEQVHRFTLRNDGARWVVVDRSLISIT